MKDNKLENKNQSSGFIKLDTGDLEAVTGGTSYGRIEVDDEGFKQEMEMYKRDGWTYQEFLDYATQDMEYCTEDEKAFVYDYIYKAWHNGI